MSKKTFFIIAISAAVLIIVGGLIWYFFFRAAAPAAPPQGAGFNAPGGAGAQLWQPVSDKPVISARFSGGNAISFYDFAGRFYQSNGGAPAQTDQPVLENPARIIWSKDGNKNIAETGSDQSNILFTSNDLAAKKSIPLKSGVKSAAFSPDGSKIVFYVSNGAANALYIANSDGKNQRAIVPDLKIRDIDAYWPQKNLISMVSKPSGSVLGNAWVLNTLTLGITKLVGDMRGLDILWSPDGSKFVYSHMDQTGQNPTLSVYDYKTGASKDITGVSTLADKCAWTGDSADIYCGVPKSWPPEALTLPDDYYKNTFLTSDDLWLINPATGEKNLVYKEIDDISDIDVNAAGDSLIFLSRESGLLYQLNLK